MSVDTGELPTLHGNVDREAYIEDMRDLVVLAGRDELAIAPEVTRGLGWSVIDVATGNTFDFFAGRMRAEVSALTKRRIMGAIEASDDPSAQSAAITLERFGHTGDNYQFTAALEKAEGALRDELLAILVEHSIMSGFPDNAVDLLQRVGGEKTGTERLGYNLEFFDALWEFSLHSDIGLDDRSQLAENMIKDSRGENQIYRTPLLSTNTWNSPDGVQALSIWKSRFEATQQEVQSTLIARASAFCEDPTNPNYDLRELGMDIERWMVSQWRWYAIKHGHDAAAHLIMPLLEANLRVAFTHAETEVDTAELEYRSAARAKQSTIYSLWVSVQKITNLVIQPSDLNQLDPAGLLTLSFVPEKSLTEYRQKAQALQARFAAINQPLDTANKAAETTVPRRGILGLFRRP